MHIFLNVVILALTWFYSFSSALPTFDIGQFALLLTPMFAAFPTQEEKEEADARSVYVGNVDYSSTAKELEQHFR